MDYGYAPAVEMEYGGYVEPPSHLKKSSKAPITGLPAEQRAVPDYDYSLFRYSGVAVPFLLLIVALAAILQALTWWQGPWGFGRGPNGTNNGTPIGLKINGLNNDAGVRNSVRNLRISSFVIGVVAFLIAAFGIRANLGPGALRALLIIAAILAFTVFVLEAIAFAISIGYITNAFTCEPLLYPGTPRYDGSYEVWCESRLALEVATTIADAAYFLIAFLLFWALIFTSLSRNWAWGPGKVSVQKSPMRPRVTYPPPSPFTHIHETRRLMVWVLLIAFLAALIWDFALTILLHQERVEARYTAIDGGLNRNLEFQQGWPQRNNAFRLAITFLTFGFVAIQLMNLATWKRRWVAYTIGLLMFLLGCAAFVVFAIDVRSINKANDFPCPNPGSLVLRLSKPAGESRRDQIYQLGNKPFGCPQWEFRAVAAVDFILAFFLCVYVIGEFFVRSSFTWKSFYFYADSEWLRNHSLFVESTDREAYDWKRFTMETGRDYYYSPTLGVSTITRPRNYIEPDAPLF